VLVGDYQKPLFIADFNLTSNELNVLAKDFTAYNFLSVMLRNRDTVMGGDDRGNLMVLTKTDIVEGDALSPSLQPISWISVGDPVTTIKRGSLVSPESIGDISVIVRDSFVYGTCKGQLGVIFELEDHL
jgi:CPSF A subunit region